GVDIGSGAVIDVSGGAKGGGEVVVRAKRDGGGLAVSGIDEAFRGARTKVLIGNASYTAAEVDGTLATGMLADAAAWLAGVSARTGWDIGAGMSVRSDADLRVSADIDLGGLSGPGHFGLVAEGDLVVDATISDGFAGALR